MKSLKQQMTMTFSLMLIVLAGAACAPEQAFAKDKGRMRANHINVAYGDGSVRFKAQRQKPNQREFDKGYLPPYAANTYRGTTTVNQGRHNNLSGTGVFGTGAYHRSSPFVKAHRRQGH